MSKIHNYSAGPCILPPEVLQEAADAVRQWEGQGLSLIEMSHRSKPFVAVMDECRALTKELLGLPDRFEVLYLQGGASLGFLTAAYNFLPEGGRAAYTDTGTWAANAIKEARHLGDVDVVASSKAENYNHIPTLGEVHSGHAYLHITTNNTIYGTQYAEMPKVPVPLVADMSSDIMSRTFDPEPFALIYGGVQKNMGPAGAVMYAVDRERLGATGRNIPSYLDLNVHLSKDSMFNTPPVFSVFTTLLTLRWLQAQGGVAAIQQVNEAKSALLYSEIDRNPLFVGHALMGSRSHMNVTFRLNHEEHAAAFDKSWNEAGISGLKGHRSVGGYRASMYNALPLESVQVLVDVMKELERTQG
ncbi:MAG: 3-phosphoserine/phosphohydroxythreonine transaminase [Bacteroidetes bacterium]|nr:3-phosphoserine/phosphohydroxythreonine transaminase [Bacteroidota bacterium]MDA0903146.1 3-phosphoserine/phosphohydroxythreonine transaminase [Bacteroidota bacterium]MDA1242393.1 3-phosphoserine/phosphohydroxythreonine transaminase [Bacteroidota bacterium]